MTTEQTTKESEFAEIKSKIHAKLAEIFKKYGKEYRFSEGNSWQEWENELRIGVGFYGELSWTSNLTKYNSNLELTPSYLGRTVSKEGNLMRFRRVDRKISLSKPLDQIYKEIEKVVATLPAYVEKIKEAQAIEAKQQANRQSRDEATFESARELSRITGYPVQYRTGINTAQSPYQSLKIAEYSTDVAEVVIKVPVPEFEAFHRAVMSARTSCIKV